MENSTWLRVTNKTVGTPNTGLCEELYIIPGQNPWNPSFLSPTHSKHQFPSLLPARDRFWNRFWNITETLGWFHPPDLSNESCAVWDPQGESS